MSNWEIVVSDMQFYVSLFTILAFGWAVFKFVLNAKISPIERQVEINKNDVLELKIALEKLKSDHQESKTTLALLNERMANGFSQIDKSLAEIKNLLHPIQEELKGHNASIVALQANGSL